MTQPDIPVLIIEDEPEIRKFLKAALESHDYSPAFAETAREGIKLITVHPPEVNHSRSWPARYGRAGRHQNSARMERSADHRAFRARAGAG